MYQSAAELLFRLGHHPIDPRSDNIINTSTHASRRRSSRAIKRPGSASPSKAATSSELTEEGGSLDTMVGARAVDSDYVEESDPWTKAELHWKFAEAMGFPLGVEIHVESWSSIALEDFDFPAPQALRIDTGDPTNSFEITDKMKLLTERGILLPRGLSAR